MTTVYLVSEGNYSDYKVLTVCSTLENAQLVVDAIRKSQRYPEVHDPEEFELDQFVDRVRLGYSFYAVDMGKDGTVVRVEHSEFDRDYLGRATYVYDKRQAMMEQDMLRHYVWAKSEEGAVKVTNEHRARLIVSGNWDRLKYFLYKEDGE